MPWPGDAAVVISPVTVYKQGDARWQGQRHINDDVVAYVSPYLSGQEEWTPAVLTANENCAYIGCVPYNQGFVITNDEAQHLISLSQDNKKVILPYLGGDDINRTSDLRPTSWVINFYDWPLERSVNVDWDLCDDKAKVKLIRTGQVALNYPHYVARDFPDALKIVEERVKPERDHHPEKLARERWWCFQRPRPDLYHALGRGAWYAKHPEWWHGDEKKCHFIGTTLTSKNRFFSVLTDDSVIDQTIVVICDEARFVILCSNIHIEWANKQGGTLGAGLRYTPSDCYDTFPFPRVEINDGMSLGGEFDSARRAIMTADQIGLTQLYNRFHNPDDNDLRIVEMRKLQVKIDNAVRDAYGWSDIDLGHDFHEVGYLPANDNVRYTISEPARIEVLKRLAKLNKERWEEEEAAGLHKKGKK